jgi:hypothetical protein
LSPLTRHDTSPKCHSNVDLVPLVSWALPNERCAITRVLEVWPIILVESDTYSNLVAYM